MTAFGTEPYRKGTNQSPWQRILRLHVIFLGFDNLERGRRKPVLAAKIRLKGMADARLVAASQLLSIPLLQREVTGNVRSQTLALPRRLKRRSASSATDL